MATPRHPLPALRNSSSVITPKYLAGPSLLLSIYMHQEIPGYEELQQIILILFSLDRLLVLLLDLVP